MSYSLHTLTGAIEPELTPQEPRSLWARFALEISLLLGGASLLLVLLALLSYNPGDAAWSTSGVHAPIRNWVGRVGAWMADLAYFSLGYSIWWCWLAGLRAWLVGFSRWLRSSGWGSAERRRLTPRTLWVFWIGMFALVASSSALEWTRLYRWEDHLPGHSGGVLGYLVGGLAMHWLGFTGSALAGIVTMVVGVSMVFRFSWSDMAERLGARIDALIQRRHVQREIETDLALGQQALREREQTASYQPVDPPWEDRMEPSLDAGLSPSPQLEIAPLPVPPSRPTPMVIEPGVTEVPRSERVVKERQKPLFNELPDSKLPQVDLLDALTARQETVSPETLEMTSRLIEKKLSDFGVQVRVVAAAPGPVITRYEIEPATGVKGSQIVNLAKDLARSLSLVSIRVIETIPGKNYMALELPNAKRQSIKLSEILGSQVYNEAKSMLTMGLGKDIVGNPVVADLAKMPHVLVAGTTGSGKSVGINAMILSLLYKAEARDVRLLMIDPKKL